MENTNFFIFTLLVTLLPFYGYAYERDQSYNRSEAIEYALKYTFPNANGGKSIDYYNPDYETYIKDCSNFISQILHYAGWELIPTPPPRTYSWFNRIVYSKNPKYWFHTYTENNTIFDTWSWVNADYLYERLVNFENVLEVKSKSDIKVADLIFMDFNLDETKDHVVIISELRSGEIYITAHTSDRYNESLSNIIRPYKGKMKLYILHINYPPPDSSIDILEESNTDEEEVAIEEAPPNKTYLRRKNLLSSKRLLLMMMDIHDVS